MGVLVPAVLGLGRVLRFGGVLGGVGHGCAHRCVCRRRCRRGGRRCGSRTDRTCGRLVLLSLYGPKSPIGVHWAFTPNAVFLAFAFVTLPFVVRTVQPVLEELDADVVEAAASLGASRLTIVRRILLPALVPAIAAGAALSFARAISEYGSLVLLSGNKPYETEVASVRVLTFIVIGSDASAAAVAARILAVESVVIVGLDVVQRVVARRG